MIKSVIAQIKGMKGQLHRRFYDMLGDKLRLSVFVHVIRITWFIVRPYVDKVMRVKNEHVRRTYVRSQCTLSI